MLWNFNIKYSLRGKGSWYIHTTRTQYTIYIHIHIDSYIYTLICIPCVCVYIYIWLPSSQDDKLRSIQNEFESFQYTYLIIVTSTSVTIFILSKKSYVAETAQWLRTTDSEYYSKLFRRLPFEPWQTTLCVF